MIDQLKRMLEYDGWANARVLQSIGQLDEPGERIVALYAHIAASRLRWIGMINGEELAGMNTWPGWPIEESRERGRQADIAMAELLDRVSIDDLASKKVTYTNAKGEYLEFAWGDVLFHSINHSVHHRAQISSEVRAGGGEPLWLDYIVMCKQEYQQRTQDAAEGASND
jgi:uncharacterized damage-inducible protein DinB